MSRLGTALGCDLIPARLWHAWYTLAAANDPERAASPFFSMPDLPTVNESRSGLKALGWKTMAGTLGQCWIVQCSRGGYSFNVEAPTLQEAWANAWQEAQAKDN